MESEESLERRNCLAGDRCLYWLFTSKRSIRHRGDGSKCNFCTLDCTLEEIAQIDFIKGRPKATQKEMAIHIGKSERTVKTITVKLSEKGVLERNGGRRSGYWLVNTQETVD